MDDLELGVPDSILESLPEDGEAAARDMQQAVEGWETRLNRAIGELDEDEAVEFVADAIERLDDRRQRFDEFVPELRAWGQSPIYAIAWRNLYADLVAQLHEHESLAERLDRERNARLVEDGISLRNVLD